MTENPNDKTHWSGLLAILPAKCGSLDDWADRWARRLRVPALRERLPAVLDTDPNDDSADDFDPNDDSRTGCARALCRAVQAAMRNAARRGTFIFLPPLFDATANPVAAAVERGTPLAADVYSVTGYEWPWPDLMRSNPGLVDYALCFLQDAAQREQVTSYHAIAQALHECFDARAADNWHSAQGNKQRLDPYVSLWRKTVGLSGFASNE